MKLWARPESMGEELRRDLDFEEFVLLAPEGQSHQPVLAVEDTLGFGPLHLGQNASAARRLRTGYGAANGAGRDLNLWIVTNAFVLPGVVARHKIEFAVALREPHGGADGGAVLAERGQRKILFPG